MEGVGDLAELGEATGQEEASLGGLVELWGGKDEVEDGACMGQPGYA